MTESRRIAPWFVAVSAIFFVRAFLYSSFLSRGPELQAALKIDTAQMGLLSMMYPAGGLLGILLAKPLVTRFGSRKVTGVSSAVSSASLIGVAISIPSGLPLATAALLFVFGMPMAAADYAANLEGTRVNALSNRSLMPAIHGSFGLGMLAGSTTASLLITNHIGVSETFIAASILGVILAIVSSYWFSPVEEREVVSGAKLKERLERPNVWFEKRSLLIAYLGFAFIMAETSAGVWVPLSLTSDGFSAAEAASALGIFWLVVTFGRLTGGFVADRLRRDRVVLISSLTASLGLAIFAAGPFVHLPYLGLMLWGIGMALGMPMAVSAAGDDPALAPARVNMVISMVYLASVTVGPALGSLGQTFGLSLAFCIPLVVMLIASAVSKVTRPSVEIE